MIKFYGLYIGMDIDAALDILNGLSQPPRFYLSERKTPRPETLSIRRKECSCLSFASAFKDRKVTYYLFDNAHLHDLFKVPLDMSVHDLSLLVSKVMQIEIKQATENLFIFTDQINLIEVVIADQYNNNYTIKAKYLSIKRIFKKVPFDLICCKCGNDRFIEKYYDQASLYKYGNLSIILYQIFVQIVVV